MKRKLVGLVLSLVLSSVVFAGGTGEQTPAASGPKKIVVGLSMVQQDSEWWNTQERFARQAVEANGWEARTVWAAGDQQKQVKDMEDFVTQKVDYIIMGPIQTEGSMVGVETAFKAGIPVITVGRLSNTPNTFGEVLSDEAEFGKSQMEQIHKDYPNGANIVYLFGPVGAGYAVDMWEQGTLPKLAEYPNLKILERYQNPSDIISDGLKTAEDAIVRFGDSIDVIACTNDGLALGAIRAVHAAGKADKIKIYASGLTLMGIEAVYNEELRYTAIRSQAKNAEKVAEIIQLAIAGGKPEPKRTLVPPTIVTKENVLTVRDAMFGGTVPNPDTWKPKK
jgi:ABC-type sugar transport system substrate-binding protein